MAFCFRGANWHCTVRRLQPDRNIYSTDRDIHFSWKSIYSCVNLLPGDFPGIIILNNPDHQFRTLQHRSYNVPEHCHRRHTCKCNFLHVSSIVEDNAPAVVKCLLMLTRSSCPSTSEFVADYMKQQQGKNQGKQYAKRHLRSCGKPD